MSVMELETLRQLVDSATFKACRDCRFCRPVSRFDIVGWGESRWRFATCHHPLAVETDNVTGRIDAPFCSGERVSYSTIPTCGVNAERFEARKVRELPAPPVPDQTTKNKEK